MLPRRVLKLLLGLLIGFWLGLILGFAASMALWYFLPTQWLANGLADRKVRHEALLAGRQCKRDGFLEKYDPTEHTVEICVCWPDGSVHAGASVYKSCSKIELLGYGEAGV